MARDGSGNYTRIYNWVTDLGNSIPITASRVDAEMDSEATALTNSLDRSASGGGDILRNVGMSNNKFTAMADGSALTDSITYKQVQNGEILFFGTTAGSSTVYTLAPSPSIDALDTGMAFWFKVDEDCGASPTINISAKGAVNLLKDNKITGSQVNLTALDLQTGVFYLGIYNGTGVVVQNPAKIEELSVEKKINIQQQVLIISSGAITPTGANQVVDGEGSSADDLNTINGGNTGDIIILSIANGANPITIKHGIGNILINNDKDVVMANTNDRMKFIKTSANWTELSRSVSTDFKTGSGHYYLPNNRLEQFGIYTGGVHAPTITFGIAFDSVESISLVADTSGASTMSYSSLGTTSFVGRQWDTLGAALSNNFAWRVVGTKAQ